MLGRDWLLELGRMASRGPFSYFFLFFTSFLFLKSYFFHRFCKKALNQFKPLSELFTESLQGFKSVGKQGFQIKTRFLTELWIGQRFCLHKAIRDLKINPLKKK
jgi:hypothetical protein